MKLSDEILEEYQGCLEFYLDAKKKYKEVYGIDQHDISELMHFDAIAKQYEGSFTPLAQAYKDALFMEAEIEKKEGLKVVGLDMGVAGGEVSVEYGSYPMKFIEMCKLCKGQLVRSGHTLLSDPPQYKYSCKECNDTTYKQA